MVRTVLCSWVHRALMILCGYTSRSISRSMFSFSVMLTRWVVVALRWVGARTENTMTMMKSNLVRLTVNDRAFGAHVV